MQSLSNITPATGDQFGWSVAVSETILVVGAPADDTGGTESGTAYIYDASTGAYLLSLNNPTPSSGDYFGSSVAVSGSVVVVGARLDDSGAQDSGAAYVFNGLTGGLIATLLNPTPSSSDNFGSAVAISGNTVAVGVQYDDTGLTDVGSAYLFDATTGAYLQTLSNPTPSAFEWFGCSIDISGNRVIVGARLDDTGAMDAGSAYIFDVNTGGLLSSLFNPTPATSDFFGFSVAISDNTAVVGAYFDDTGAPDAGCAYAFNASSGSLVTTFNNPTPASSDIFGYSVAVSGNTAIVGAYSDNTGASDAGCAYAFNALTGVPLATLNNPTPLLQDFFGFSVALSGNVIVVGAMADDTPNSDQGAAYVFSLAVLALGVGPVTPDPRNTSVSSVQIAMTSTVDLSTFTSADFTLTRNGGGNLLTGAETVTYVSGTTYQINGLAGLTGLAGTYVLTVNMSGVNDLSGNPGAGTASDAWVMDLTAPAATSVAPVVPNPRNTVVTQIDFTFSEPVDLATLTAADLTLTRGGPNLLTGSETITLVSGSTYRIGGLAALTGTDGVYTLTVLGAGVQDWAGNGGSGSPSTSWTMDTVGPQVFGVFFDGIVWAPSFRIEAGNATYGYPAQTGAEQLTAVPWSTVNTVFIQFSENVNLIGSDLGIRGLNLPNYNTATFTYDNLNFVAKWVLTGNIDTDRIVLDLDGDSAFAVDDSAGNKLAGSWTEGSSTFPTSGAAGNDFKYRFVVAVGDADRNGVVRNADLNLVRSNLFIDAGAGGYNIYADIDGNGLTRNADLNAVRNHLFIDPPAGPGPNRPVRGATNGDGRNAGFGARSEGQYLSRVVSSEERPVTAARRLAPPKSATLLDVVFTEG